MSCLAVCVHFNWIIYLMAQEGQHAKYMKQLDGGITERDQLGFT